MKTRTFMLLAAVLLVSAGVSAQDTMDFAFEGIKYTGDKTTMTAMVVGTDENFNKMNVVIPDEVNGYTVTSIQKKAFNANNYITHFESPSTLTSIGFRAFAECKNLQSVKLSNTLQVIEDAAFYKTESLEEIYIPNSVEYLGSSTLSESGIKSVHISDNLKTIPPFCFGDCKRLQEVSIPNSVTKLDYQAFSGCTSLQSVFIPASVKEFGKNIGNYFGTFEYCPNLNSIIIDDDNPYFDSRDNCNAVISTTDNCLLMGCSGTFIPQSVQGIYMFSFMGSGIQNIVLSDNVMEIGEGIFDDCKNLASVALPQTMKNIPDGMFQHCESLSTIKLPSSVTSIGVSAFSHCYLLSDIVIPNSVTNIGARAFRHTSLQTLDLPSSLKSIGEGAFRGCEKLKAILFPKYLSSIERLAFADCTGLTTVTIPKSVTSIGDNSFSGCNLETVYSKITDVSAISLHSEAFSGNENATLYVPYGLAVTYKTTPGWNIFKNIEEMKLEEDLEDFSFLLSCNSKGSVTINGTTEYTNKIGVADVNEDTENTFVFTPKANCKLEQVCLNGFDMTLSVENNTLKAIVPSNSQMIVTFANEAGDLNNDGNIDISDVVSLVNIILGQ